MQPGLALDLVEDVDTGVGVVAVVGLGEGHEGVLQHVLAFSGFALPGLHGAGHVVYCLAKARVFQLEFLFGFCVAGQAGVS